MFGSPNDKTTIEHDVNGNLFRITVDKKGVEIKRVDLKRKVPLWQGGTCDFGIKAFKRMVQRDKTIPKKQMLIDQYKEKAWGMVRERIAATAKA